MAANGGRRPVSRAIQIEVFRRDLWLCHWCGRPVIFGPTMKYLERFARGEGWTGPLAYHHAHWTRRDAPLLDYMGAVIDHREAHSKGGPDSKENLVAACCKCNALKSDQKQKTFEEKQKRHVVKGKYGEPEHWDGLSTLFVILAERKPGTTASERDWLKCLCLEVAGRAATGI